MSERYAAAGAPLRNAQACAAARRRSHRKGRERGCHVYISGEQLQSVGFKPGDPPPFYRIWESSDGRPRLLVNLYREP